jgi:protein-tyrosine-phosphatase
MAEAFYNKYTGSEMASSAAADLNAGIKYRHPASDVVTVMREENIDVSKNLVKPVDLSKVKNADRIIVLCDLSDCPKFVLDSGKVEHIPVSDPHSVSLEYTRSIKDDIKRMVLDLIDFD